MNKRERSEAIYAEITAEGYDLKGQTPRKTFIDRCVMEAGMTEKGAATYYRNAKVKAEGGKVPNYYEAKRKQTTEAAPAEYDGRWSVIKVTDNKVEFASTFATEEKARIAFSQLNQHNKEVCIVIPGVMHVGEVVQLDTSSDLIAANPSDVQEEE